MINGDLGRNDVPYLARSARIILLAELHQVDAMLRQCRPNRGGRIGLASLDL